MLLDSGIKGIFMNALHQIRDGFCGISNRHTTGTFASNSHGTPSSQLKRSAQS
jgi:hypothetical protein